MATAQDALNQIEVPNAQPTAQEPTQTSSAQPQQTASGTPQAPQKPQEVQGSAQQDNEADPKLKQKVDSYVSILMNELHGPETRDDVVDILKSSKDPFMTVPQAALTINDMAKLKIEQAGGRVDINTQFLASQYLVSDLMEIGNSFGVFKTSEKDFPDLYQDSLQMYIERGLKDGSIDPIELQLEGEKFMTQNQKIGGHYLAQEEGMPYEPQQTQMLTQFERSTRAKVRAEELDKQSKVKKQENDQQIKQALLMQAQGGQ